MRFRASSRFAFILFLGLILLNLLFGAFPQDTLANQSETDNNSKWTIHFRPGLRWGTDNRTLYILDFLVPLYQDEKNILFINSKFTPNDHDGWETNLGLGYRHILIDEHLLLGINGFYDWRKTPWGTHHEQWGIGAEVMAEIPIKEIDLGLTGRFNYYHPTTSPHIELGPNGGYINQGGGVYVLDVDNIWLDEPMSGYDGELGFRVPYVSDYVETWIYAGGYHFEGEYFDDIDGFSARLEVIPTDFLKVSYEYRDDNCYGGNHYGEVSVNIPFSIENLISGKNPFEGLGKGLTGSRELKERLTESVHRDVDIVTPLAEGPTAGKLLGLPGIKVVHINEDDYSDFYFEAKEDLVVFVSETGSNETGDGSRENPYLTLGYAMLDDRIVNGELNTIYVLNSSESESDRAGGGDIEKAGMLILGSGFTLDNQIYRDLELLAQQIDMEKLPSIGSPLTIKAPFTTVMGLKIDVLQNYYYSRRDFFAIEIQDKPEGSTTAGINIMKNIFNVNTTHLGDTYGINTINRNTSMGNINYPLTIAHNEFNINSDLSSTTAGIYINTEFINNHSNIFDNTMIINSTLDAYGIKINGNSHVQTLPTLVYTEISDNTINVTSLLKSAFGVYGYVEGPFVADIGVNDITATSKLSSFSIPMYKSCGIYLDNSTPRVDAPFIPNPSDFFADILLGLVWEEVVNVLLAETHEEQAPLIATIYDNTLKVSSEDEAYGIFFSSYDTQYLDITKNKMPYSSGEGGIIGKMGSHGIRLETKDKDIHCNINENIIYVKSEDKDAYGISCDSMRHIFSKIGDVDEGNNITIRCDSNNAYGIWLKGNESALGKVTGSITYNKMSGEIIGLYDAYGIYIQEGLIGISTKGPVEPFTISNNELRISSNLKSAYGIKLEGDYIYADIENNIMAGDIYGIIGSNEAYGIYLDSNLGIGSSELPLSISGNLMNVTENADGGKAYGIYIKSDYYQTFANITNNTNEDKTKGITVKGKGEVGGIYLAHGNIGSLESPLIISSNLIDVMHVTSNESNAYGIRMESPYNTIYSDILFNYIKTKSLGKEAYGIFVNSDSYSDEIGSALGVLRIENNRMKINSFSSNAYGVFTETNKLTTEGNIFANISKNDMIEGITSSSSGDAVGILMKSPKGIIDTTISENSMNIYSEDSDAAGILLMGREFACGLSDYGNNPNIAVKAPNGITFDLIDAIIVEGLAELNNQIENGSTGWIYLESGDYSGSVKNIERYNLTLWGKHYEMFGIGGSSPNSFNNPITTNGFNTTILGVKVDVEGDYSIKALNAEGLTIEDCIIIVDNISPDDFYSPDDTYGIYISGYDIGSSSNTPLTISNNSIWINYTKWLYNSAPCNVYGIYVEAENDIGSIAGYETFNDEKVLVSEAFPAKISNNDINITSHITPDDIDTYSSANSSNLGICLKALNNMLVEIEENNIGIAEYNGKILTGDCNGTVGIYLEAGNDVGSKAIYKTDTYDGIPELISEGKPLTIKDNIINLSRNRGSLLGIYSWVENDAFMEISGNDLHVANMPVGAAFFESSTPDENSGYAYGIDLDIHNDFSGSINDNNFAIGGYDLAYCIDIFTGNDIGTEENPFEITENNIMAYSFEGNANGIYINGFDIMYADISNNVMRGGEIENGEGGGSFEVPGIFSVTGSAEAIFISTILLCKIPELPTIQYGSIGSSSCPVNISDNEMILINNKSHYGLAGDSIITLRSFYSTHANISGNRIVNYGDKPTVAKVENIYWTSGGLTPPRAGRGSIDLDFTLNEVELKNAASGLLLYAYPEFNAVLSSHVNMGSGPKGLGSNSVYLQYEDIFNWYGNYGYNNEVYGYMDDDGRICYISP